MATGEKKRLLEEIKSTYGNNEEPKLVKLLDILASQRSKPVQPKVEQMTPEEMLASKYPFNGA